MIKTGLLKKETMSPAPARQVERAVALSQVRGRLHLGARVPARAGAGTLARIRLGSELDQFCSEHREPLSGFCLFERWLVCSMRRLRQVG